MMYPPKIGQKVRLIAPKSLDHERTFIVDAVHGKTVEMHKEGFPWRRNMEHIANLMDLEAPQ